MIFSRKLFSYFALLTTFSSGIFADSATCCETKTSCQTISQNLWQPRAFSSYRTREIIMLQDHNSRENVLSFGVEYMQSFGCQTDRLGALPFWSGSNTMTIGKNDGKSDLDAYQFGLGHVDKAGSITLTPKVQHVGAEMLWRVAHSAEEAGGYFQVKVPLAAMMIETKTTETPATFTNFPYAGPATLGAEQDPNWDDYPVTSVRFDTLTEALISSFEHREPDLKFGRLCSGRNTVIRAGDIEVVAGYNFYGSEKGYVGAGFKVSCPTGNVPDAKFILEPVVGRAGHWGVGAELQGSYKVHDSDDMTVHLSVRSDVLHLFSGRTPNLRSFDLALNGAGSKYLLLQRYVPGIQIMAGADQGTEIRTPGEIAPAINITTVPVKSTVSIEGSFALALTMQKDNWNASLIGEFWGRAHECLKLDCNAITKLQDENLNDFAVLGRQIDENYATDEKLYYCEPLATIKQSEDRRLVFPATETTKIKDARKSSSRIPTDHNVALDVAGAQAPRALTGKFTAEAGYTWTENNLVPHISVFGGVEFADKSSRFVNMWSVGVQGSMNF